MMLSRSEFVQVRNQRMHCRHWGDPDAPLLIMVHGWMDVGASFQFMVDSLNSTGSTRWHVIAPDLRGFGLTTGPAADTYWFPDYLADLDVLLDHYSPHAPVNLLGHSMGGNIVGLYAGTRPERIAKCMMLEGFGLPSTQAEEAPGRYRKWLDQLRAPAPVRHYASVAQVARRLQKTNPRLTDERAGWLAQHWSRENERGEWEILGDRAHKIISPILYRVDEVNACWAAITAPVLWMEAAQTEAWNWLGPKEQARIEVNRRIACFRQVRTAMVENAGHMLHHDQPDEVARLVAQFLTQAASEQTIAKDS